MSKRDPTRLLRFWFDEGDATGVDRLDRWFRNGRSLDVAVRERFGELMRKTASDTGWKRRWAETPEGLLAGVILLDQLPRHAHRGTAQAYENDLSAVDFVEGGLRRHDLLGFSAIETLFLLMPYQHSENLRDQLRGERLLKSRLSTESDPKERELLKVALKHQKMHRGVIQAFGRFPKRNQALHRRSTTAEEIYMRDTRERAY